MDRDRFAYEQNLEQATAFHAWRSAFWPPGDGYRVMCLDLAGAWPSLGSASEGVLDALRGLIEQEWQDAKLEGAHGKQPLRRSRQIAELMRRLAELMPDATDRRALGIRADALERGYNEAALAELATLDEGLALVVGRISTWYGKQVGGLPTAFACVRNAAGRAAVARAISQLPELRAYVRELHAHLRLAQPPAFSAVDVCFMAGEGNRHPKHIAYFLPEDEGIKFSPFKKTYYFGNTHRTLLSGASLPLAERLLDVGTSASKRVVEPIPTLGVLAHELGHGVHREQTNFKPLNAANRWVSIVLQETAADVFGTLFVAQVLAGPLGLCARDVVTYYLAECLRYVDRGLGSFPDSDGMLLQLNYFASLGALHWRGGAAPGLAGDPDVVIAALRSLARVLADTLLAGDVARALALHASYGPGSEHGLSPLIASLRGEPPRTIEYLQEPNVQQAEGV